MVVSTAFEELTELLRCLETSDAEIREVALREQSPESGDELAADLTVGVPVLPGVSNGAVSVEASGFEVQDQRIDVDVTVTLPVTDDDASAAPRQREYGPTGRNGSPAAQSSSVPSYKDPDALQAVYDEYDTFPEMTDALGADVTSETVRRYMVEYDIHDPSDNTPQAHALSQVTTDIPSQDDSTKDGETSAGAGTETAHDAAGANSTESRHTQRNAGTTATADESNTASSSQPTGTHQDNSQQDPTQRDNGEQSNSQQSNSQQSNSQQDNTRPATNGQIATRSVTHEPDTSDQETNERDTQKADPTVSDTTGDTGPESPTDEASDASDATDELGRRSVAEMIAESDSERTDDKLVADGLGIPQDMTVAELADVVNQSNTIYEVTQQLDMKQGNARRLLQKLNLIDFVIHRLAADQINVSHEEIARRIAAHD